MEAVLHASSAVYLLSPSLHKSLLCNNGIYSNQRPSCLRLSGCCYSSSISTRLAPRFRRKSVIVGEKKNNNRKNKKEDTHSFVAKPNEATGPFPEAVLLKEKKVQEDGELLPEFDDEEEEKLYEFLNLQLQSELDVDRMRHYEVVYLIHEQHAEEVATVNQKIQDFLREKKGRIWRVSDWGMRKLAYKIQKAKNAHYMLMNFELEAQWINEFKIMLDKDERVIRHLVIKRDEAITEDCPPPPEFQTMHSDMDDDDDDMEEDEEEEGEYEDDDMDNEEAGDDDDGGGRIIYVNGDDEDENVEGRPSKSAAVSKNVGSKKKIAEISR